MTVCCQSKSLLLPLVLLLGAAALAFGASSFAASVQDPKPPPEKPKDGPGEKPKDGPGEKPREGGRGWGRGPGGPGGGLEGSMQSMKAAVKALEKELPAKDANAWKSISQFERGVAGAKLEEPKSIKELPEGQRAAALATYRSMMADLLQSGCKLEHEVLAGKWDDAGKTFNESIKPMKKRGHDKFNPDDDK
jgi:hypothetical protein